MSKNAMMRNISIYMLPFGLLLSHGAQAAEQQHKRFSVSAGWLHVMPQGSANPFNINTAVIPDHNYKVGDISSKSFLSSLARDDVRAFLKPYLELQPGETTTTAQNFGLQRTDMMVPAVASGEAKLYGIDQWRESGSGLEAEKVDTLGLTLSYYATDHVSLQLVGGIPPKVDIKGKGKIVAKMTGIANTSDTARLAIGDNAPLKQDILITDLAKPQVISTARAWTPALIMQYQFGRTGVNKFRPYIGAGVMYAYFNDIKLNSGTREDLVKAGHMVQNILDHQAGASLDGKLSSAKPHVKVDADDALAPLVNLGFTYDLNDSWYAVASVSYAKLNNQVKIKVVNSSNNQELIRSSTKIDIDPIITYLGVGYRF